MAAPGNGLDLLQTESLRSGQVWPQSFIPPCLQTWHGRSQSYHPFLYQDNSLDKTTRLKEKTKKQRKLLKKQHLIAMARIERNKIMQETAETKRKLTEKGLEIQAKIALESRHIVFAAVCIQRHVRGWLDRLRYERIIIQHKREEASHQVKSLSDLMRWLDISTENSTLEKVKTIQKAFRRYRRLKMISVVSKVYEIYKKERERWNCEVVNRVVRSWLSRLSFKTVKMEHEKAVKLPKIRENLACIKIGICWRRLNLTVKGMRMRIRRYLRRLRSRRFRTNKVMSPKKGLSDCESPMVNFSNFASPKGFSDALMTLESGRNLDMEDTGEMHNRSSLYSSLQSVTNGTQSRDPGPEIVKGRTDWDQKLHALGFNKPKELAFQPFRNERKRADSTLLNHTPDSVFIRLLAPTEATSIRSSTSHSIRVTSRPHRRTATATPPLIFDHIRMHSAGLPGFNVTTPISESKMLDTVRFSGKRTGQRHFMNATESFTLGLETRLGGEFPRRKSHGIWKPQGSVLGQTIACITKQQTKRTNPQAKFSWKSSYTSSDPEYIPSIDNSAYPPQLKRFKAIPFDPAAYSRPQTSVEKTRPREGLEESREGSGSSFLQSFRNPSLFQPGDMPLSEHFSSL